MPLAARDPYGNDDIEDTQSDQAGEVLPLLTDVDHVGYAVDDLDAAIDRYRDAFGLVVSHREVLHDDGMEVARLAVGDSAVHLLAAVDDDSGVAEFLAEWGPGLHHVGYRVPDCARALEVLAEIDGVELIDPEPTLGFDGATVAWVDASTVLGSLIQLVETSPR